MGEPRLLRFCCAFVAAVLAGALTTAARAQDASEPIAPPVIMDSAADATDESAPDDEPAREGQRPAARDGDTDFADDTPPLRDGIIETGEPLPPEDGVDAENVDVRDPAEAAAFENPPADPDPLLFQIEDLDPIRDNRAVPRLFLQEPYDPVGIPIGSFVLFPEVEIAGGWSSNVFRAPSARSDTFADIRPSARLVSNWRAHALEFRATGTASTYNEFESENDKAYLAEARGRIDVTRRTNVQGLVSREQALESRSALNASTTGSRVKQVTDRAEVALNQRFNRLSLQFRGSVSDSSYGDTELAGLSTPNDDRDLTQTEETVRASWEFKPTLSVFGEVAINQRDYDRSAASDGIIRSSDGQRYRAGVSFGNTGEILRGEIALGYGVQTPDAAALEAVDGVILDANATWRVSELTSVLFTARSDVSETTTANVGGAFYRSAGLEVRHALRRHLIVSAGLHYATQESEDSVIDESELRAALGVEYFVNRETILFGRYTHTNYEAVGSTSDYEGDDVRVGIRLRR